jgi:2-polyprenyl-3-methyl-5-hydroxy-6-metoxy-1,4-benzoquinol methylase
MRRLHWTLGRVVHGDLASLRFARAVSRSELFDPDFYLADNPDVAERGEDPLVHYVTHGAAERRFPSAPAAPLRRPVALPVLWIVSGPSSAGKSTLISSPRIREITSASPGAAMLLPSDVAGETALTGDAYLHFNILRPADRLMQFSEGADDDFEGDPEWRAARALPARRRALILRASKEVLVGRVRDRVAMEQGDPYPSEHWLELYEHVDLDAVYSAWRQELERAGIPWIELDAEAEGFPELGRSGPMIAREEIEDLLASHDFGYHRVALPHGLVTPGDDRGGTAAIAFPEDLRGRSVLDVGCALGYFCFEAERRGAARVVGVELKPERYEHANLLKGVLGSGVEFRLGDFQDGEGVDGGFDVVLALNLLHHLSDPVGAIRRLAALADERLVLEFPTFADPKFRRSSGVRMWRWYDRRPVLGVGSKEEDQTFVFTEPAVRQILRDHAGVRDVAFQPSPLPGRLIAICEVGAGS